MSSGEEEIDGKPIGELRVIDLKELLDKRGLSKTGSKTALVKRLREHVQKERLLEEQQSKDLDSAPNMEMKSCGSDLVAEYLEKQQIALQAAKKAAEAARATLSSEASSDEQESREERVNADRASLSAAETSESEQFESISKSESAPSSQTDNLNVNSKHASKDISGIESNADKSVEVNDSADKSVIKLHSLRNIEQMYQLNEHVSADLVQSPGAPVTECETSDKHDSNASPHIKEPLISDETPADTPSSVAPHTVEPECTAESEKATVMAFLPCLEVKESSKHNLLDSGHVSAISEEVPAVEAKVEIASLRPPLDGDKESRPSVALETPRELTDNTASPEPDESQRPVIDSQEFEILPSEPVTASEVVTVQPVSDAKRKTAVTEIAMPQSSEASELDESVEPESAIKITENTVDALKTTESPCMEEPHAAVLLELRKESDLLEDQSCSAVSLEETAQIERSVPEAIQPVCGSNEQREEMMHETLTEEPTTFTNRNVVTQGQIKDKYISVTETSAADDGAKNVETVQSTYSRDDEVEISAPPDAVDELLDVESKRCEQHEEPQSAEASKSEEVMSKPPQRKRKWKATTVGKRTTVAISSESLKEIVSEIPAVDSEIAQLSAGAGVLLDYDESPTNKRMDDMEEENMLESVETVPYGEQITVEVSKPRETLDEKPVDFESSQRLPSPPRYPVSNIIHVRCLTRPFTTRSLHQLLAQFGTFSKDDFWMDGIKSHCLVKYENEEDALRARNALHNLQWPPSNQKVLRVDFATQDDLDRHRGLVEKKPAKMVNSQNAVQLHREPQPRVPVEVDRRRITPNELPVETESDRRSPARNIWPRNREWDRGKLSREQLSRTEEEVQLPEPQKKRMREDEAVPPVPARLLEELFRKTKCTPCVYWLPLTEEQVSERENDRKQRELERAERIRKVNEEELLVRKERERKRTSPYDRNRRRY